MVFPIRGDPTTPEVQAQVSAQRVAKLSWQIPGRELKAEFLKEAEGIVGIPKLCFAQDLESLADGI